MPDSGSEPGSGESIANPLAAMRGTRSTTIPAHGAATPAASANANALPTDSSLMPRGARKKRGR